MEYPLRGALALLICCLAATPVGANLVLNSDLDSDVISWRPENPAWANWSTDDADGSFDSGSIEVGNTHPKQRNGLGVSQCLPLVTIPGTTYRFGGKVKIPEGQDRTEDALIGTRFYDDAHCSGTHVGSQPRKQTAVVGSWVELVSDAGTRWLRHRQAQSQT